MEEDLHKIKLNKQNDINTLFDDIPVVKVEYRCSFLEDNKTAVVLHMRKFNYVAVMTATGPTVTSTHVRGATTEEPLIKMHKQYCISVGKYKGTDDDNDVKKIFEYQF